MTECIVGNSSELVNYPNAPMSTSDQHPASLLPKQPLVLPNFSKEKPISSFQAKKSPVDTALHDKDLAYAGGFAVGDEVGLYVVVLELLEALQYQR